MVFIKDFQPCEIDTEMSHHNLILDALVAIPEVLLYVSSYSDPEVCEEIEKKLEFETGLPLLCDQAGVNKGTERKMVLYIMKNRRIVKETCDIQGIGPVDRYWIVDPSLSANLRYL